MKKVIISTVLFCACIFGYNFYVNMKINFLQNEIVNAIKQNKYLTLQDVIVEKSLNSTASEIYFTYKVPQHSASVLLEIYYKKNFFHFRPIEVIGDINLIDEEGSKIQKELFGQNPVVDFVINASLTGFDVNFIVNSMKIEDKAFKVESSPLVISAKLNNFGKMSKYEMTLDSLKIVDTDEEFTLKKLSSNVVFKKALNLAQFGNFKNLDIDFLSLEKIQELSMKNAKLSAISNFSNGTFKNLAYDVNSNLKIEQIDLQSSDADNNASYHFDFTTKLSSKINFNENAHLLSYSYNIHNAILNSLDENSDLSFTIEDLQSKLTFLSPQNIFKLLESHPNYEAKVTAKNIAFNEDKYFLSLNNLQSYIKFLDNGEDKVIFNNIINLDNFSFNDENFALNLDYNIKGFNIYLLENGLNGIIKNLPNAKFKLNNFLLTNQNNGAYIKADSDLEFYGKYITKDNILDNFSVNSNLEFNDDILLLVKDANSLIYTILMQNLNYLSQENYLSYKDKIYKSNIKYIGRDKQILLNNQIFSF